MKSSALLILPINQLFNQGNYIKVEISKQASLDFLLVNEKVLFFCYFIESLQKTIY